MKKMMILVMSVFCFSIQSDARDYSRLREVLRTILPCKYGENGKGFIFKGKISLRQVNSGSLDSFDYYTRGERGYVKYGGRYYPLNGRRVIINDIQYYTFYT